MYDYFLNIKGGKGEKMRPELRKKEDRRQSLFLQREKEKKGAININSYYYY